VDDCGTGRVTVTTGAWHDGQAESAGRRAACARLRSRGVAASRVSSAKETFLASCPSPSDPGGAFAGLSRREIGRRKSDRRGIPRRLPRHDGGRLISKSSPGRHPEHPLRASRVSFGNFTYPSAYPLTVGNGNATVYLLSALLRRDPQYGWRYPRR